MSDSNSKPEKLTIVSVGSPQVSVTAQYNPKEVSIDKNVPWSKHKNPKGNVPMLEFSNAENRTMSFELFFDEYESKKSVYTEVQKLETMTMIPDPKSNTQEDLHPPLVVLTWGAKFPSFRGVIESLGTKYTMFLPNGTPVRATCTIKLKEVSKLQPPAE